MHAFLLESKVRADMWSSCILFSLPQGDDPLCCTWWLLSPSVICNIRPDYAVHICTCACVYVCVLPREAKRPAIPWPSVPNPCGWVRSCWPGRTSWFDNGLLLERRGAACLVGLPAFFFTCFSSEPEMNLNFSLHLLFKNQNHLPVGHS